jgi:DNA polymerase-1
VKYLSPTDDYWALDIEADSLEPTQIWVVCVENIVTGEKHSFKQAAEFLAWQKPTNVYVAHFGIHFDFHHLNRLWAANIPIARCIDTVVLSYLHDPYIPEGHSLDAWGKRVKMAKLPWDDFSRYTPEMEHYCSVDTSICRRTYLALTKRMERIGYSENSCWLEHHFAAVIDEQQRNGFQFDIEGAKQLYDRLRAEEARLLDLIRNHFPPRLRKVGTYEYKTTRDGRPYSSYTRHTEKYPKIIFNDDGTYTCFEHEVFNVGSPAQRLERLLQAGFKPVKKTKSGGWATGEEVVLDFFEDSKIPEIGMMAEWLVLNGRANMINNWLENVNYGDSRIHGAVFSCGAGSRRCKHSSPNTANIPSTEAKFGAECRGLWTSRDNRVLVGIDAAGLEGRILVHYLGTASPPNRQAAYDYILDTQAKFGVKDFHTLNAQEITKRVLPKERKPVKNDFYALIYGATDRKLGAMSGGDEELGTKIRKVLGDAVPGLGELMEEARKEFYDNGGLLRTIDGGFVRCESPHAALNYRCQSAGAIVMKLGAILLDREIKRNKWDTLKVGDIHDEWQFDTHPDCAELVGEAGRAAIRLAGEKLKLGVPLDGTYAIGKTWADTH